MNDEVKEILIDLVDYYNSIGTDNDPGIGVFENVAQRASKTLEQDAKNNAEGKQNNNSDVDPFKTYSEFSFKTYNEFSETPIKLEEDW